MDGGRREAARLKTHVAGNARPPRGKRGFFSEKKKQKTFDLAVTDSPSGRAQVLKVFWFFFSKKNTSLLF
jgi:hypothetical protein